MGKLTETGSTRRMPLRRRIPQTVEKSPAREAVEWVVCILAAVALALLFNTFVAQLVVVEGSSMIPTLQDRERMLVTRSTYRLRMPMRGEVVVTHYPDPDDPENYVKRVVGLPGDTVEIADGTLYVNGQAVDEPYLGEPMNRDFEQITVPDGCVFVLGDNRNISRDSRYADVGPVPLNRLLGEVHAVVWPLSQMRMIADQTGNFTNE